MGKIYTSRLVMAGALIFLTIPLFVFNNCSGDTKLDGTVEGRSIDLPSQPPPSEPPKLDPVDPILNTDFTKNSMAGTVRGVSVPNLVTINRNSIGTYRNNKGLILTAIANQPRFDHDPAICSNPAETVAGNCDRKPLGLLVEGSRINRVTYSSNFLQAAWTRGAATTVTANATMAPDGTMTASRVQMPNMDGTFLQLQNLLELGKTYTLSLYARSDTPGQICFGIQGSNPDCAALNLSTQWQRFSVTLTANASTTFVIENSLTATETIDAFIWGVQVEEGPYLSSYIPTNGAAVTRLADWPSIPNNTNWFNEVEGSFFVEWSGQSVGTAHEQALFHMSNVSGDSGYLVYRRAADNSPVGQSFVPGLNNNDLLVPPTATSWTGVLVRQNLFSFTNSLLALAELPVTTQDRKTKVVTSSPRSLLTAFLAHGGTNRPLNGHLRKFQFYDKSIQMIQTKP